MDIQTKFQFEEYEYSDLDKSKLDISERTRRSRLPWRGQFSPELVEYLISGPCQNSANVYDPFCGSGTVLFEAIRNGRNGLGAEVNPAAWHLAYLAEFTAIPKNEQLSILQYLNKLIIKYACDEKIIVPINTLHENCQQKFTLMAIAAAILLGMGNSAELDGRSLAKGIQTVLEVLKEIHLSPKTGSCVLGDARSSSIATESVDAVITSPPYINVFNYHQNYRPAVEAIGWRPLDAAQAEIGSNRKNRSNRFLTVIQYCLDIGMSLQETGRVMKRGATMVLVVGRTSNVLGVPFKNGKIIKHILDVSGCLAVKTVSERVFTNRFGEKIFEDVLVCKKIENTFTPNESLWQIGENELKAGLFCVSAQNRPALEEAIEKAQSVKPSPLLKIDVPLIFK